MAPIRLFLPAILAVLIAPTVASAQGDEIQVYDGGLAKVKQFNLTLHNNFTPNGIKTPAFPGGVTPDGSWNGVPEWALGVTKWLEAGLYLPLYSYDYDQDFPNVAKDFKSAIGAVDAVLFVTPEYNRSIPGGLKNAIDWASRPYGKNSFARKPSAIIGTSTGKIGTAVAQQHLRSILAFCNSPLMNSIEAYIQFENDVITDDGRVTNPSTEAFLRTFMVEFAAFIGRVYTVLPRPQ